MGTGRACPNFAGTHHGEKNLHVRSWLRAQRSEHGAEGGAVGCGWLVAKKGE